jgi:hypothetical protein
MSERETIGGGGDSNPASFRPPRGTRRLDSGNVSKGSLGLKPSRKKSSHTADDSIATPSSVHLNSPPNAPFSLTRELSDLSGSYYNGGTNGNRTALVVPLGISTSNGWRHAQVLSTNRLPQHPQPHFIDDDSSYHHPRPLQKSKVQSSVLMERNEVIEVCVQDTVVQRFADKNRTPLILLLMDPTRKCYELLQLWMDTSTDTVRDILQTINRNLVDNIAWKQDYDGLFQVRNNHFSQLIHVLPAGKYDIVPGELWVCKPWSMSSKQTVSHASTCLNHLKEIGVLQYRKCSEFGPLWKQFMVFRTSHSVQNSKMDDTVLVLSKKATQRLYVPGGILKHHHACQFLSFVPQLDTPEQLLTLDPDACAESTASGLSDSHTEDGVHSEDGAAADDDKLWMSHERGEEEADVTFSTTDATPLRPINTSSTVCSAKTKESAYVLRSSVPYRRSPARGGGGPNRPQSAAWPYDLAYPSRGPSWRFGFRSCWRSSRREPRKSSNTTAHTEEVRWESASHSSGVPLLRASAPRTVDWISPVE